MTLLANFYELIAPPFVKMVENPKLTLIPGIILSSLYFFYSSSLDPIVRNRVMYGIVAWWIYAIWETYIHYAMSPSKIIGAPIRVDLLLIMPILCFATLYILYHLFMFIQ